MGLLAEIPIISPVFQAILGAIGWVLAELYDLVGNYGVAIILLTVIVRIILLPLGIKQIRSMHNMQSLQPKIKQLQQKYKGNKQRQQEEIMKLYRESGVNPLSGCWPVLLQFPILIAMYAVLRPPTYTLENGQPEPVVEGAIHLPEDSELYRNVALEHEDTDFLWMNMQCSALQAGTGDVGLKTTDGKPTPLSVDCGDGWYYKIPYFTILALMVGSTFYQQRQMQRAAPPGATNAQQQALFKIMPILFGVFGVGFPSGLVVYWTTSNLWQIGQQSVMLRLGHIGPQAQARPAKKPRDGARKGIMARMTDAVELDRTRREQKDGGSGSTDPSKSSGNTSTNKKKPGSPGSSKGSGSTGSKGSSSKPGSGGSGAGSRKKRPKR